ncbi:MAG: 4-alpha-glucanotransferase [Deltaproteobacteria bacterium]|nr:4-alpha-glucanotransferase [Deltaproteobacteria bacterium]
MTIQRSCGLLLHITSLPGACGIGTLGDEACRFVDSLQAGGQRYWQILPFGPVTSFMGYSPYASTSTFAGNEFFISPERLQAQPWFRGDIGSGAVSQGDFVDFEAVSRHKLPLLRAACDDFFNHAAADEKKQFTAFCEAEKYWLDDYVLFAALARHFDSYNWLAWDAPLAHRDPAALDLWREKLAGDVRYHQFVQYVFYVQWRELKQYCNDRGVQIIGDIPIYITFDGADAWAHPEIFQLDSETEKPLFVAGVPPDYFSETGQRWGNPLYIWKNESGGLCDETLQWWVRRIKHIHELVDIVRIDHFRAFETYWSIPAEEETAMNGTWIKGPGRVFFDRLRDALGELPLIAEDLGDITPGVEQLRDDLGLPGMKVLQFAFDGNRRNAYLPHTYADRNCVVYTGTHDNNTTNGWFYGSDIDDRTRAAVLEYLGTETFSDFHWMLIRLAYRSTADLAVVPVQDVLGYGEEFRMNRPGIARGNWCWKLKPGDLSPELMQRLQHLAQLYDRV